jgi:hypothetical protein
MHEKIIWVRVIQVQGGKREFLNVGIVIFCKKPNL